ncbi:MAG: secretin and TonB N-terminal domain-containing protein, partial [Bacteroidales bacterium]
MQLLRRKFAVTLLISALLSIPLQAQIKISGTFDHIPLVEVLKKLNQAYGIKFAFDDQVVQNIYVSVNLKSVPLPQALEKILSGTELEAVYVNDVWIIKKKVAKPQPMGRNPLAVVHNKTSGESVPYARITIDNQPLRTDVRGIVVLPPIKHDTVTIQISSPGFRPVTMRIAPSDLQIQNFELEPSPQLPTDTTSTGAIFEIGERTGEIVVNAQNVKWLPQLNTLDALAPLSLIPGIDATFENIDKLIVRHQASDKNLVTLDGFNIYHTDHLFGAVSSFNVNAIKDIRIRRGTFDASEGGHSSTVVELTGKTGNEKRFSATAGIDQLAAHLAIEGPLGKNFSYLFTARRSLTDWYQSPLYFQLLKNILSEDISFRQKLTIFATDTAPSSLKFYDLNAKISFHPTPLDLVTLSGYTSDDQLRFKLVGTNQYVAENAGWGNKGTGWQWSRQWNSVLSHKLNLGYSSYQLQYFHHDTTLRRKIRQRDTILKNYDIDNQLRDLNANFAFTIRAAEHHTFETGISRNTVEIKTSESYLQTNNQLHILDTSRTYRFNPTTRGAWLQYTFNYSRIKALSIALRAERYNLTRKTYLNPRFEGYFTIYPQLVLKTSAGTYRQYVYKISQIGSSYRNIWMAADGNDFPIAKSDKVMIGFTWRPADNIFIDAEAYQQHTTGMVIVQKTIRRTNNQLKASNKIYQLNNRSWGIDCMARKKWPHTEAWVAYSLSQSLNQSDNLNGGKEYPALDNHLHEVKLGTIYWWRKWSIAATWIYGSPRPWDELKFTSTLQLAPDYEKNASLLPAYHRLDASIAYSFKMRQSQLDCGLKLFNLYNRQNILARVFTLNDTPLLDYMQGKTFYT